MRAWCIKRHFAAALLAVLAGFAPEAEAQAPTVSISSLPGGAVPEGKPAEFKVTRTGATDSALTVLLTVSENTEDERNFVAPGNEGDDSVVIPAGYASWFYYVPTEDDAVDEPNGTVTVALRASSDYTWANSSSASVTVASTGDVVSVPQTASIDVSDQTVTLDIPLGLQGKAITFYVTTSRGTARGGRGCGATVDIVNVVYTRRIYRGILSVSFTTLQRTFRSLGSSVSIPLEMCSGSVGKTFHIQWDTGDYLYPDEYHFPFDSKASNCSSRNTCFTEFTITDSPVLGKGNPVSLSVSSDGAIAEGDPALTVTATLEAANTTGATLVIPVRARATGTTAQSGDYTVASSISIADGAKSGTGSFAAVDDGTDEPSEKVFIELGSPLPGGVTAAGSAVLITIEDNDATVASLGRSDSGAVAEGGTGTKADAEFTVTLSRALAAGERIDVPLVLSGSGVTVGDFNLAKKSGSSLNTGVTVSGAGTLSPTVIFENSGARTATLVLTPEDDDRIESDETLTVALGPDGVGANGFDRAGLGTNVGGGADPHGSSNSFDVVIESEDVDPPPNTPVVSISGGNAVTEGGSATFTLTAVPEPSSDITVKVTVTESGDFTVSGETGRKTVAIGVGGTGSLTVATENDDKDEPDGAVKATLNAGDGYGVGSPGSASVRVRDDDGTQRQSTSGGNAGDSPSGSDDAEDDPSPDREALLEIYKAAGGESWTRGDNWDSDAPVGTWYGVSADSDGRVTELFLDGNGLSGTIHQDIGKLEKLEVLYMNDNGLSGAVPAEQLQSLGSLEELALWGNPGLAGTIPDELGKRVDRAALRSIKEANGGSALSGWFAADERVFDYSGWEGVSVNDQGRVSELDFSGAGLSGDIADALWALSGLERLDLSGNPDLTGELPPGIADTALEYVDISGSGVCASEEFARRAEDSDIVFEDNENCVRGENPSVSSTETGEPGTAGEESGGGGCSVAPGGGPAQAALKLAPLVLLTVLLSLYCSRGRRRRPQAPRA